MNMKNKENIPIIIENEEKEFRKWKNISLVLLIVAFIYNILLFFIIDYNNSEAPLITFVVIFIYLLLNFCNIYHGYIKKEFIEETEINKKKKKAILLSIFTGSLTNFNTATKITPLFFLRNVIIFPYYLFLAVFSIIFIMIFYMESLLFKVCFAIFLIFIYIIMFLPLTKANYYFNRRNGRILQIDNLINLSWKNQLKGQFITLIPLLIIIAVTYSIEYKEYLETNKISEDKSIEILNYDSTITFTEKDYETITGLLIEKLGENISIRFGEISEEKTSETQEKYIYINCYVYQNEKEEFLVYTYKKYLTESKNHKLGELEEY